MGQTTSRNRAQRRAAERQTRKEGAPREPRPFLSADLWIAGGLTLLAWVHRLIFLRSNRDRDWPYTFFYEGDSETFYLYARALLKGQLYDNGIPFHPPGFAWVLAKIHSLVGAGEAAAQVPHATVKSILALFGAAAVGVLYLLVRPYLGRTAALLGSVLCLYHFGLYVLSIAPVTESVYLFLLLLALLVWSRRLEHPLAAPSGPDGRPGSWGSALLLGLLLGALALTRAEGALVAVLLIGTGLAGALRRRDARALRPWLLAVLGWVLIVAPWAVRNARILSGFNERLAGQLAEPLPTFVPLTIYGPINLALANNPLADGSFSRDFLASQSQSPVLDLTNPQHLEFILHGDRMAWRYARENPADFARLVGKKWRLVAEAWTLGWTQWNWPGGLTGDRRPVDVFVPASNAASWIGLPLALLGLLVCLESAGPARRWAGVVLLATLPTVVATGLFFGYVRLGLLVLPLWLSLAGAALAWAAGRFRLPFSPTPAPRWLWGALGGLAAALLVLEIWGVSLHRNFRATGVNVPGQSYLDRDQEIHLELLPRDQ